MGLRQGVPKFVLRSSSDASGMRATYCHGTWVIIGAAAASSVPTSTIVGDPTAWWTVVRVSVKGMLYILDRCVSLLEWLRKTLDQSGSGQESQSGSNGEHIVELLEVEWIFRLGLLF
ncbi:hypothetical protein AC579_5736 [Pseudocercospora musae]|uniref:Uncharacterized protein n=1 Tax=Pseudocercospora musae TaxID=113226 RepID=A0A139ISD1_9PEZI|nr:hypothetical protein AC579_5736 [Pseudocercospora musae]